jgi:hypothetical protein
MGRSKICICFLITIEMEWFPLVYLLVNPEKEAQRFAFLKEHLPARGIPQEKIRIVKGLWGDEITSELYFRCYDPFTPRFGLDKPLTFKGAGLLKGEVSLNLTFFQGVLHAIHESSPWVLFLESDCILRKDFMSRLESILKHPELEEADYISLGEGVGTRPVSMLTSYYEPTKLYEPTSKGVFRCTDSMLFKRTFLEKIHKTFLPFKDCLDWELNMQIIANEGVAKWADPPLVEQGSCRSRVSTQLPS